MKRRSLLYSIILLTGLLSIQSAGAAERTRVYNIRTGIHPGYTRLVLDSEGARPFRIGPATPEGITLQYEALDLAVDPGHLSRIVEGEIAKISYKEQKNPSSLTITFSHPNTRVKFFMLTERPSGKRGYKLVLDFYPPTQNAGAETSSRPASSATVSKVPEQRDTFSTDATGPSQRRETKNPLADSSPKPTQMTKEIGAVEKNSYHKKPPPSTRPNDHTKIHNIRTGNHPGYTRLVLDSEGAHPFRIGPATPEGITLQYEALDLAVDPGHLSRIVEGEIAKISFNEKNKPPEVTITFRHANTQVESFILPGEPPEKGGYRIVLDLRLPAEPRVEKTVPTSSKEMLAQEPEKKETIIIGGTPESKKGEVPESPLVLEPAPIERSETAVPEKTSGESDSLAESHDSEEESSTPESTFSGNMGMFLTGLRGERESSKFTEYRDFAPVSGELALKYEKKDRYFYELTADDIARDDQVLELSGGIYGKVKMDASYDMIPHRFAFGARTLYSGVGSDYLSLDDALQTRLQNGTSTIEAEFQNAVSGDPAIFIDKAKMNLDLVALDPFNIRIEVGRLSREGTRPFSGSFGLDNTQEIPRPVDDETRELKFIGEYSKTPFQLSAVYHYSQFKNSFDTLMWDNPFRVTDAPFGPSKGRTDLAPNNESHNVSVSGSYMDLPLASRISATAAWGWMMQDDDLLPYTVNTAFATPELPKTKVDAEVRTSLYHALLNSRPLDFMRMKAEFRHFEYNNNTLQINFPGFVDADDFFISTPIVNLPTSYDKTKAGLNLGFDLFERSGLSLGYAFERTNRTNREVDRQDDQILSGSVDIRTFSWLDVGASYQRTQRDISDYNFDVYLSSGEDLGQLPGLRKYTEADMVRDRVKFLATVYPAQPVALSGSLVYGKDNFEDSPYGLIEDKHYVLTFDAEYSVTDRLNLHAFYSYEKYKNMQKSFGEVPSDPFPTDSDWYSKSEDIVKTVGGEAKVALVPGRLDLDLSYSFSKVDGKIDFFTPVVETTDFPTVDETSRHILEAKLVYHMGRGFFVTLGYLWEKFAYDDFNREAFSYTPAEAIFMGTLPSSYDARIGYLRLFFKF